MSKKYHVQRREFLNIFTNWRAYVIASVEDSSDVTSCCEGHNKSEVFFEIASCNEEIELHFSLATPRIAKTVCTRRTNSPKL